MQMHRRLWLALTLAGCSDANPLYTIETGEATTSGGTTTGDPPATTTTPTTTFESTTDAASTTAPVIPTTGGEASTTADATTDATATTDTTTGETGDSSETGSSSTGPGFCGDGQLDDGEACDDGPNNADTAACKSDCTAQACGDGFLGPGEGCDDGNTVGADGCSAVCISEACGNNIVDGLEACDDGANGDNDDGCTDLCLLPACGDMFVQPSLGEACDDGPNNNDNAACTFACQEAVCGDGLVNAGIEACDDGADNGDTAACTTFCELAVCGDGLVHAGVEDCDDGADNGDTKACTSLCEDAACGDGLVYAGVEDCDDGGNNGDTKACTSTCADAACGDGLVYAGVEDCDGGAANSDLGTCTSACQDAVCGDGLQSRSEACDDGNLVGGDGCDASCKLAYQVFPASNHTCALFASGAVRCWGGGGILGTGNVSTLGDQPGELPAPALNLGGTVMTALQVYGDSTCALSQAGSVYCWGYNFEGQLGVGTKTDVGDGPGEMPPAITNVGATITGLGGGIGGMCAITQAGALRCWGRGEYGRLGIGSTANIGDQGGEMPPTAANVGATVARVSMSETHTCVVTTADKVRCWGNGSEGALGYGNTQTLGDGPGELPTADVPVGVDVVQVGTGHHFTCALLTTGNVRCWGRNDYGQLGQGDVVYRGDNPGELPTPDIKLGGSVARIAVGYRHVCARMQSGAVKCWGSGFSGSLGTGNTSEIGNSPGEMPPTATPLGGQAIDLQISNGLHSCVVLAGGAVRCWGENQQGQLGIGSTGDLGDNEAVTSVPAITIQ